MRHLSGYNRLGRRPSHRKALLRNMATSLVVHEKIDTTLPKAKEIRTVVERLITLGKRGDMHAKRLAAAFFFGDEAVSKVFGPLAARFKERPGGYTRILRLGVRLSDGAKLARLELLADETDAKVKKASTVEKKVAKTKTKAAVG